MYCLSLHLQIYNFFYKTNNNFKVIERYNDNKYINIIIYNKSVMN